MIWQDIVLTIGNLVFLIALFPSVFSSSKPAVSTSLITAGTLLVFGLTYITLDLIYSSIAAIATAVAWTVLALQKIRINKKNDQKH